MSDTPETDNNAYECIQRFEMGGSTTAEKQSCKQGDCVSADFARKLERERDEARNERDDLKIRLVLMDEFKSEILQAYASAICCAGHESPVKKAELLVNERDELRAELERLKADKARLDWLEKRESMEGFTRDAIDAAMKGEL